MNKLTNYSSSNFNKYRCRIPFVIDRLNEFYRSLIQIAALTKPSSVLSIGCGECFELKNMDNKGAFNIENYYGLDFNLDALKIAKKNLSYMPLYTINGDIYNLPFKLNKFDLILGLEVLEHLSFPNIVLKKISESYEGYCLFSVPNEPWYRLTRMLRFKKDILRLGNHPEHLNNWSSRSFGRLIKKYFEIDQIATPSYWTIILCHKKAN